MQMTTKDKTDKQLYAWCQSLIECGGNLNQFLLINEIRHEQEAVLFDIETRLDLPENVKLRALWDMCIARSNKIRMQLVKCKAYELLERYETSEKRTGAADISYARAILFPPKSDIFRDGDPAREGNTSREKDNNRYAEYEKDFDDEEEEQEDQ